MRKPVGIGVGLVLVFIVAVGGCVAALAGVGGTTGPGSTVASSVQVASSGTAGTAVPADWELLDQIAAAGCPGLPWSVLAAIGRLASDSGRAPMGPVTNGPSAARLGPMQLDPVSFARYATIGPGGANPASPNDTVDATYTTASLLCGNGGRKENSLPEAVAAYDASPPFVDIVLVLAQALASDPQVDSVAAQAIAFGAGALGAPYLWGGVGPAGFDCSGLVQAAYGSARLSLPRVAQAQFDRGPRLDDAQAPQPGDLLFFGPSTQRIDHVGLYIGAGQMIDAPHTGANVRLEAAHWPDLVGITRPG